MTQVGPLPVASLPVSRSVADLRAAVARWRAQGDSVALVPTMGALHDGHLSLIACAKTLAARVIVSIFVNPTQFGPREDFSRYPRQEAADSAALATMGTDLLYAPPVEAIYPPGFATTVTVAGLTDGLCGAFRPGHFAGVATVVTKLLLQAGPDVAVFGEKDYQQLQVIRRAARDLDIATRIVGAPTMRDAQGLALSSRNAYLSGDEKTAAVQLNKVLATIAERLKAQPDAVAGALADGKAALAAAGFAKLDYLEVCDADTLAPLSIVDRPARVLVAAWLGRTRLIDNRPI
jgi:pantoate--beta-alanine ligase